jgi:pimeloyl-ACP methyl ester carboxylesterase
MEKIRSKDGTAIAFQRSGSGIPLVMVHGTISSHGTWAPVLPALEQHFTVYALDRRGRGESGDTASYAFEHEVEDIAAVVDAIGGKVNLFGHSFGALCVLEAALLTPNLHRLIAYEPSPLPVSGVPLYEAGIVDRLQALVDAGEREQVVIALFRDLLKMPPEDVEYFKASPRFPQWVAAAHTVPRETLVEEQYQFKPERFQRMTVPTLLLQGSTSRPEFKAAIQRWHAALPVSRVVELEGQEHLAYITAPDLFVREVQAFLQAPDAA